MNVQHSLYNHKYNEAIYFQFQGKFSHASDIWSFAVTLWEMYSLCKIQPYANLDDKDVIDNMHQMFRETGQEVRKLKP